MTTTKFKLKWLHKRKDKLKGKVERAFFEVRKELIDLVKEAGDKPTPFIKYLAAFIGTSDVISFIKIMQGIIEDAKKCKGDPEASKAIFICRYSLFRLYYLSNFTLQWTNVSVECNHCHRIVKTNFLYTNNVCDYCGHIIL